MPDNMWGIGHIDDDLLHGIDGRLTAVDFSTYRISGACASSSRNVFKIKFSEALSSVPFVKAYDTRPLEANFYEAGTSTLSKYDIFKGTVGNGYRPMLNAIDTTRGAPSSQWYTTSTIGLGIATCLLDGVDSYLQFRYSLASLTAGASLTFNCISSNNQTAGGTESVPAWNILDASLSGILYADATATSVGHQLFMQVPESGTETTKTAWVADHLTGVGEGGGK